MSKSNKLATDEFNEETGEPIYIADDVDNDEKNSTQIYIGKVRVPLQHFSNLIYKRQYLT
jgi:hypothetical protein